MNDFSLPVDCIWSYLVDPKPIRVNPPVFTPPLQPNVPVLYVEPIDNLIGSSLAIESIRIQVMSMSGQRNESVPEYPPVACCRLYCHS